MLKQDGMPLTSCWNLESAVKFEKAFSRLAKDDKSYVSHFGEGGVPKVRDWTYAREFISAMKLFCDVTGYI